MKTQIEAIDRYIELKKKEKDVQKSLEDLKPLFFEAAETLARVNQSSQIEVSGALLYRRATGIYEYPKRIQVLESKLKREKALYENHNLPKETRAFWVVKF